jgi:hypothetical protein
LCKACTFHRFRCGELGGTNYGNDDEVGTAIRVLDALRGDLKAHTKRRMDRIPNNVAWNEKATHIDFDLRSNLNSIHGLKLELKHWIKRRLKAAQRHASI